MPCRGRCVWWSVLLGGLILAAAGQCFSRPAVDGPDAAAAALGVAGCYVFWRWLERPTWPRALAVGLMLGIVELTKFTWIILVPLWPVLWIAWRLGNREHRSPMAEQGQQGAQRRTTWGRESQQMAAILLVGLHVINTGYGFEGSFQRLGDFTFLSRTLAGEGSMVDGGD